MIFESNSALFSIGTWNLPKFFPFLYVPIGEEGNVWKSEVLVTCKYFYRSQIGLARMIDEPGNISIIVGIDAKGVAILKMNHFLNIFRRPFYFALNFLDFQLDF